MPNRGPVSGPRSTYRLQINEQFDLDDAAAITGYLRELGADWVYLSPILPSGPGSDHGYDVTGHDEVDAGRGGAGGLQRLADAVHELGGGILVDIVPNHVGVEDAMANEWWRDVLEHGRGSRYAEAFDIDWSFGDGRVRIPVLGDEPEPALEVHGDELGYHEQRFPLAHGSTDTDSDPARVHDRQHYELISWRRADHDLNYRRFFAVNTLAALRVEVPWVFDETHREIGRWVGDGLVDGLRVDHPDGLADPGDYLARLRRLAGPVYLVVEKILEGDEQLPASWPVDGTTGYEVAALIDRLLVDPDAAEVLDAIDARIRDRSATPPDWAALIHDTKRDVADRLLHAEVLRITRDLGAAGGSGRSDVADAVAELLACFPTYRSYLPDGHESLEQACAVAAATRPDLAGTIDAIRPSLCDPRHPAAVRFQQTSGMVMAKGVEDCAFYRMNRLGSLTEVGGDPSELSIDPATFHHRQQGRHAGWPASMTTLTTHDTKRSEDVRARIDALSEMPERWSAVLERLHALVPLDDRPFEQLLWQAAVGAWPITAERLRTYAVKAAREAGTSTTWQSPSERFEAAVGEAIDRVCSDPAVTAVIEELVTAVEAPGWSNSLAAKLIQLTSPGVPDVYQGSELWELSLVDPDNRRPVDYARRGEMLATIDQGQLPAVGPDGAAKLLVTSRALRLRRDRPELFTRYRPLFAVGDSAEHCVAFDRGGAVTVVTRHSHRLGLRGGWKQTTITLPTGPLVDALTGRRHEGGVTSLDDLLQRYPVALLIAR